MKNPGILAAFLSGAALGTATGILFAPAKGETTRMRIKEYLCSKGICLTQNDLDELAELIAAGVEPEEES